MKCVFWVAFLVFFIVVISARTSTGTLEEELDHPSLFVGIGNQNRFRRQATTKKTAVGTTKKPSVTTKRIVSSTRKPTTRKSIVTTKNSKVTTKGSKTTELDDPWKIIPVIIIPKSTKKSADLKASTPTVKSRTTTRKGTTKKGTTKKGTTRKGTTKKLTSTSLNYYTRVTPPTRKTTTRTYLHYYTDDSGVQRSTKRTIFENIPYTPGFDYYYPEIIPNDEDSSMEDTSGEDYDDASTKYPVIPVETDEEKEYDEDVSPTTKVEDPIDYTVGLTTLTPRPLTSSPAAAPTPMTNFGLSYFRYPYRYNFFSYKLSARQKRYFNVFSFARRFGRWRSRG